MSSQTLTSASSARRRPLANLSNAIRTRPRSLLHLPVSYLAETLPSSLCITWFAVLSADNAHVLLDVLNALSLVFAHPNFVLDVFNSLCVLLLVDPLARWCIPVVQHLDGEDSVERESCDVTVKDDWVGDFLDGGEDARQ